MNENVKISSGYVVICLLWGSTWLAIRLGLDSLTPVLSAGIRFCLAALMIYTIMRVKKIRLQTDREAMKIYWMLGIFSFIISYALVYWAEQFITSGLTSVLFGVMPFMVIIFSRIVLKDKIGPFQSVGVMLGFTGLIIIFSKNLTIDFSEGFLGMAAVVLSAMIQGYLAVKVKKAGMHLHPLSMNFIPVLIGGVAMTIYGVFFENMEKVKFDMNAVISVFYLALFGTVFTFTTYYWLLKRMNVVILSLSAFITPIVALLLGWMILDEKMSARDFAGTAMVLLGILFANFRGLKKYYLSKRQFAE